MDPSSFCIESSLERTRPRLTMKSFFYLVAGLLSLTTGVSARQKHVQGRHCKGNIRHVHIAVGRDPSTMMTVSFSTVSHSARSTPPVGAVLLGTSRTDLHRVVIEQEPALFYNATRPRNHGIYFSPYQHHIELEGLEPDTEYFYQCLQRFDRSELEELKELGEEAQHLRAKAGVVNAGVSALRDEEEDLDDEEDDERRRLGPPPYDPDEYGTCPNPHAIRSFRTAPKPGDWRQNGRPLKFAIVGDFGQFEHSTDTLKHLRRHRHGISAMVLAGDIAYTEFNPERWDTFFDMHDDLSYIDELPMMIATGNHDIDKMEHEREIFQAYEMRFRMPRIAPPIREPFDGADGRMNMDKPPYPLMYEYGNAYYDFIYGTAHHIVISSYSDMDKGSLQYEWLLEAFASVDRAVTPWLFVTFHCPFYNTFRNHQNDYQVLAAREHIEPLLIQHRVNMVFSGHVHAYMRTHPVANGTVTPTGPIYVVVGAGGRAAESKFLSVTPEEWVAERDATIYGYGSIELVNKTHARWDWIHTGESAEHNTVWQSDVELPPGGTDHTFISNQYYMDDED